MWLGRLRLRLGRWRGGRWRRRGRGGCWLGCRWRDELGDHLGGNNDFLGRGLSQAMLHGPECGGMYDHDRAGNRSIAASAARRGKTIKVRHKNWKSSPRMNTQRASRYETVEFSESEFQPRTIHQVQAMTRIRLPRRATSRELSKKAMLCFPKFCRQAEPFWAGIRCEWQLQVGWRSIALPRRVRSFRSGRIAWQLLTRIGFHQSSCQRAHGVLFHGQKPGGIHRRSWLQAVVAGY